MKRSSSMRNSFLIQDALHNINEMLHLSIRTDDTISETRSTMRLMRSIASLRIQLESGGTPDVEDPSVQALIRALENEATSILTNRSARDS